jgi:hypothetical protein
MLSDSVPRSLCCQIMIAITDPYYGSAAWWSLGRAESSSWIDPTVTIQGRYTLQTHDPSEKLLNIGGVASRPAGESAAPAGAATLLGLKPTTLESHIKKLGLQRV